MFLASNILCFLKDSRENATSFSSWSKPSHVLWGWITFQTLSISKTLPSLCIYIYTYVYVLYDIICIYIHKYLRMYVSEQKGKVALKDKETNENQHRRQGIQRLSICCVNSGTVTARYCCEPREVNGAKPVMKKCRRGNGTKFTAILRKSQFSCPGKRKQQVTPLIAADTKWFRSP